jgi:hypothetical protein
MEDMTTKAILMTVASSLLVVLLAAVWANGGVF